MMPLRRILLTWLLLAYASQSQALLHSLHQRKAAHIRWSSNDISEYDDTLPESDMLAELYKLKLEAKTKQDEWVKLELMVQKMSEELKFKGVKCVIDYGFRSKSEGSSKGTITPDGSMVPENAFVLALDTFKINLLEIFNLNKNDNDNIDDYVMKCREQLKLLTLSNEEIWKREDSRPPVRAPYIIKIPYYVLCLMLDKLFDGRPLDRFFFLEVVARMPYFSYITLLHAYETINWWRRSVQNKRVHFAEEFNEYHHLLIWESLGGDQNFAVRFFAQHSAIAYFFILVVLWLFSPSLAYNFSELLESHAVDTYGQFLDENEEILKKLPAPMIAQQYYESPGTHLLTHSLTYTYLLTYSLTDRYIFDEFQTQVKAGTRQPVINNLYDVVRNVVEDERQHVLTMRACQDPVVAVKSPNNEASLLITTAIATAITYYLDGSTGDTDFIDIFRNVIIGLGNSNVPDAVSDLGESIDSSVDIGNELVGAGQLSLLVWIEQVMAYVVKFLKYFV